MYLRKHAAHKHLVLIVNKCDLVPTWVTKQWVTKQWVIKCGKTDGRHGGEDKWGRVSGGGG